MTLQEANQMLRASEALVKCGRGSCSQKTYDAICAALVPQQRLSNEPPDPNAIRNLVFAGIELSVNQFVEDGCIIPIPRWWYGEL
jgi:hypothetical protein